MEIGKNLFCEDETRAKNLKLRIRAKLREKFDKAREIIEKLNF